MELLIIHAQHRHTYRRLLRQDIQEREDQSGALRRLRLQSAERILRRMDLRHRLEDGLLSSGDRIMVRSHQHGTEPTDEKEQGDCRAHPRDAQ